MIEVIILWVIAHPLKMLSTWVGLGDKNHHFTHIYPPRLSEKTFQVSADALFMTFVNVVHEFVVVDSESWR